MPKQSRRRTPKAESRWRKAHSYDLYEGWPPSVEQQERAREDIAYLKSQYDETNNPVWAGRGYGIARGADLPIPAWVLDYLDRAFGNVEWLMQGPGELRVIHDGSEKQYPIVKPRQRKIAPAIAAAFGFVPGGVDATDRKNHHTPDDPRARRRKVGRWNPLDVDDRDLPIAVAVCLHVRSGSKLLHAYEHAAAENKVTRRTAERAWAKHKRSFGALAKK